MDEGRLILFLDDMPARAGLFSSRSTPADRARTIWARTVDEAIEALLEHGSKFDILYLDHDLGGTQYQDSRSEDSGMEVVRWLEKNSTRITARIVIHTWNIEAGRRMVSRLTKAGFKVVQKPFGL